MITTTVLHLESSTIVVRARVARDGHVSIDRINDRSGPRRDVDELAAAEGMGFDEMESLIEGAVRSVADEILTGGCGL
jgi:chromosome segregation ATPase